MHNLALLRCTRKQAIAVDLLPAHRVRAVCLSLAFGIATGCGTTSSGSYEAQLAAAERAFHAGRFGEAALAYENAAARTSRARDQEEAVLMAARCLERMDRWREAKAKLAALVREAPQSEQAARAAFELADIEIHHGDRDHGFRMLEQAIFQHREHGITRLAIVRVLDDVREQGGEASVLAWIDRNDLAFRGTSQEEVIAYERARSLRNASRLDEAHDAYLANARAHPYPKGGLTDDAYYHAAEIDEERGRYLEAIAHLRELLSFRESSSKWGSNERPRYSQAQFHIAVIYRDHLRDRKAARREFEKLYAEHSTSTRRAEALWSEARLTREEGDEEATCALMRRLFQEFPDSRYARCTRELCAGADQKPPECAEYIRRELHPEVVPSTAVSASQD